MESGSPREALRRAIDIFQSQDRLAAAMGVTQGAVSQWLSGGLPVSPKNRVLQLEAMVVDRVGAEQARQAGMTRHHFRPDIYPAESGVAA